MFQFPAFAPLRGSRSSTCWVPPFGNPRVYGHLRLTVAYRSLSRPSSPPHRGLSQLVTSFLASESLGIPRTLLLDFLVSSSIVKVFTIRLILAFSYMSCYPTCQIPLAAAWAASRTARGLPRCRPSRDGQETAPTGRRLLFSLFSFLSAASQGGL